MKLVAIGTVKNEADIIESFVRHNLRQVNELLLIDHGSTDRTPEILRALQQEGLALRVERSEALHNLQDVQCSRLARQAFADGADWVIPLDADEFIAPAPGRRLADLLSLPNAPACLAWRWASMVPMETDDGNEADPVKRIRARLSRESQPVFKVLLSRAVLRQGNWALTQGNHQVTVVQAGGSVQMLPCHEFLDAALRHYPVRSPGQFVSKVVIGWLATRERFQPGSLLNFHLHTAYQRFKNGEEPRALDMSLYAMNYQEPETSTWRDLTDDPLPVEHTLRHTRKDEVKPLVRLVQWLDTMALGGHEATVPVRFDQARPEAATSLAPAQARVP